MNTLDYFNLRLEATISPMDYLLANKANPHNYFLLDVRNGPAHLRKVAIAGAYIIPEQEIKQRLHEIPKDKQIILYCWDTWCNTAAKVAKLLLENDYQVRELTGGIAAWQEMRFPIVSLTDETPSLEDCGC